MKRQLNRLRPSPVWVAVVLSAGIIGCQILFAPGYVDNGDFAGVLRSNGLYQLSHATRFSWHFGVMQYYNPAFLVHGTTQSLLIQVAMLLSRLTGHAQLFDIRYLGFVYGVTYLGGIGLLTRAITTPQRTVKNYFLAVLVIVVLADASIVRYFNSLYPQAATLILIVYVVALALLLNRYKTVKLWLILSCFMAVILLLMVNEDGNFWCVGVIFITLSLWCGPMLEKRRPYLIAGIGLILMFSVITATNLPKDAQMMNKYQAFTQGALVENQHPERYPAAKQINPQFTLMRGNAYYPTAYAALKPNGAYTQRHLLQRYNLSWVVTSYVNSGTQFSRLLNVMAKNTLVIPLTTQGSVISFVGYSQLMATFYPKTYGFNVLLALVILSGYAVGLVTGLRRNQWAGFSRFMMMFGLLTTIILIPIVTIVNYGLANLAVHLVPVVACLNLSLILVVADCCHRRILRGTEDE